LKAVDFCNALELLRENEAKPKLTTGNVDFDSLLGGGIEQGFFYIFYGDNEDDIDYLLYRILCNSLLPLDKFGFSGKVVFINSGSYRQEQLLLDIRLIVNLLKANGTDTSRSLDRIYTISAFNEEQQQQAVEDACKLLLEDSEIKLVVARNITSFHLPSELGTVDRKEQILKLQRFFSPLWQACQAKEITLIISCKPRRQGGWKPSPPDGGSFLRHQAHVMIYLRRKDESDKTVTAFLLKHPNRQQKTIDFSLYEGDPIMGRLTTPFRSILQEEMDTLKRSFREALMDPARRDSFDCLVKAWTSEQGAMSYAKVPSTLEAMLLLAVVENRKLIEDLREEIRELRSKLDSVQS